MSSPKDGSIFSDTLYRKEVKSLSTTAVNYVRFTSLPAVLKISEAGAKVEEYCKSTCTFPFHRTITISMSQKNPDPSNASILSVWHGQIHVAISL